MGCRAANLDTERTGGEVKSIRIKHARQLCEAIGARQAIVIGFDEAGRFAAASYGATKAECAAVGALLDDVVSLLSVDRAVAPRASEGG